MGHPLYGRLLRQLLRLSVRGLEREWQQGIARPREAQRERLAAILELQAGCAFAREHSFSHLDSFDTYRKAVPIHRYSDLAPWLERMAAGEGALLTSEPVLLFAVTSGTTGTPKTLPITRSMNLEQHRCHRLWMGRLVRDHPGIPTGHFLTPVSPAEEGRTAGGIPYGSASGRTYLNQALPIRRLNAVPYTAMCIPAYEARRYAILAFALCRDLSLVTSVNPSTLYQLAESLARWSEPLVDDLASSASTIRPARLQHLPPCDDTTRHHLELDLHITPQRARFLRTVLQEDGVLTPRRVWPHLKALCTWHGGNAPFYLNQLPEAWGRVPTRCLGLRASEGLFSIPLADRTPEGTLAVTGHVLEFLPAETEPTPQAETLLAHELEVGKRYRLITTTAGGLYRYDMADILEVTGMDQATPVVAFLHKAGKVLSITGEKVTEVQVVEAMTALEPPFPLAGFSVTLDLQTLPRYCLAVEPRGPEPPAATATRLAADFDAALSACNIEYASKRRSGRLGPPVLRMLPNGSYAAWRCREVEAGRPDGQIKPPHLVADTAALDAIAAAAPPPGPTP